MPETLVDIVVLASADGSLLGSERPLASHPLLFEPLVAGVLRRAAALHRRRLVVLLPPGDSLVRESCAGLEGVEFVERGSREPEAAAALGLGDGLPLLLLRPDAPFVEPETLRRLAERCGEGCALAFAGPSGGGSVSAACLGPGARGAVEGAGTLEHLARAPWRDGEAVRIPFSDPAEHELITDRLALWRAQRRLQWRVNSGWLSRGVAILDPLDAWIDPASRLESDVVVEPGVTVVRSAVCRGTVLERGSRLLDSQVGPGCEIKQGSYIVSSAIGEACQIGPYAQLRPGCRLGARVKAGNFVELKKSRLGDGTKVSHLSYVGDAELGRDVNVGCGFITCNYDGVNKSRTVVGDGVFIGSDCQAVAPVSLGAGSYIAAGSTITEDVPAGALALSRTRQVNKEGLAERLRAKAKARKKARDSA